jgi:hypothetical protein
LRTTANVNFSGLTSTLASAGSPNPIIINNSTTGGTSAVSVLCQSGGVAKGTYGWQTGTGMLLYDTVNSSLWLSQGIGANHYVRTFSNILDDGTGATILAGTSASTLVGTNPVNALASTAVAGTNGATLTYSGTTATLTASNSQDISSSGTPTFVSVKLQTTGGTPTALNYYEETSGTLTLTFSGGTTTLPYIICRVGRHVTFSCTNIVNFTSSGAGGISSSAFPSRFSATPDPNNMWFIINGNNVGVNAPISLYISSGNSFQIFGNTSGGNFGIGASSMVKFSLSWMQQ